MTRARKERVRYTVEFVYETDEGNVDIAQKMADRMQNEYAVTWLKFKAHGKVDAVSEKVDRRRVVYG